MYLPTRVWINQPSTLQPLHKLHGKRAIAVKYEGTNSVHIFFTEGLTYSMSVPRNCIDECLSYKENDYEETKKEIKKMPVHDFRSYREIYEYIQALVKDKDDIMACLYKFCDLAKKTGWDKCEDYIINELGKQKNLYPIDVLIKEFLKLKKKIESLMARRVWKLPEVVRPEQIANNISFSLDDLDIIIESISCSADQCRNLAEQEKFDKLGQSIIAIKKEMTYVKDESGQGNIGDSQVDVQLMEVERNG